MNRRLGSRLIAVSNHHIPGPDFPMRDQAIENVRVPARKGFHNAAIFCAKNQQRHVSRIGE